MPLEFKINQMDRQVNDGFVVNVYWTVSLTDGAYSSSRESKTVFEQNSEINFIPFEELTEDLVIGWVKGSLTPYTLRTLEECLILDINLQKTPPTVEGIPWDSN